MTDNPELPPKPDLSKVEKGSRLKEVLGGMEPYPDMLPPKENFCSSMDKMPFDENTDFKDLFKMDEETIKFVKEREVPHPYNWFNIRRGKVKMPEPEDDPLW